MQGHRATTTSWSELFDLDHGSSSSNTAVDQPFCWGNIQDPAESREPENLPPSTFMNPFSHEHQNLLEDRGYGQNSNLFSLDNVNMSPQLGQSSSSRSVPVNLNMNPGFVGQGSESSPLVECPDMFKSSVPEFQWLQSSSSTDPHTVTSSGGTNFGEASASRPGSSVEGRRLPCKRKAFNVEGHIGSSSMAGSSSNMQNADSSLWPGTPSTLGIPEPVEPRLALGVSGSTERLRRNFRVRLNSPAQNVSNPPCPYSAAGPITHSSMPATQLSSGMLMTDHTNALSNDASGAPQPAAIHVPAVFPPSGLSVRWNRGPITRSSSSSDAIVSREAGSSSNVNNLRNIQEHPMFISANESSTFVQNPVVRSVGGGAIRIPGNVPSASRTGTSSAVHQSPSQGTRQLQYPRRLSEYVRRSLSSVGSDAAGHNNNFTLTSGPSASAQAIALPFRSGSHSRHSPLRSAYWMERQVDNVIGLPYSARTLAAASEGRRRLVSEIRNVLDMMRRGEGLRIEDFMILDQSVFLGVADLHDRHRDMRLDVDNMSYEELLALEERIGNVSTGLNEEIILARLKQRKCTIPIGTQNEAEPCCVCQEEYNDGEDIGTLECGHDFHRDCIKQWLMHKNICPICKTTGLKT